MSAALSTRGLLPCQEAWDLDQALPSLSASVLPAVWHHWGWDEAETVGPAPCLLSPPCSEMWLHLCIYRRHFIMKPLGKLRASLDSGFNGIFNWPQHRQRLPWIRGESAGCPGSGSGVHIKLHLHSHWETWEPAACRQTGRWSGKRVSMARLICRNGLSASQSRP